MSRLENELKIDKIIENKLSLTPDYVQNWAKWLKASNKTASTRLDYINKIIKYLTWINTDIGNISINSINSDSIESYMIDIQITDGKYHNIKAARSSDSYKQGVYYALQSFLKYLYKRKYISENYIENIEKPQSNSKVNANKEFLSEKDFKLILHQAYMEHNPILKKRDIAILTLFMTTGMRETALLSIDVDDIDFSEKSLTVIDKEEAQQTYQLSEQTIDILNNWLSVRKNYIKSGKYTDALFISYQGNRMSCGSIQKVVQKYSQKGIGKKINPHKLRAGYCSILYEKKGDIEFVRRSVGHSKVTTTQRYIHTKNTERNEASEILANLLF